VIGGYNCFKATAVIPVSQTDFRNLRTTEETTAKKKEEKRKPISWIIWRCQRKRL
jgi:hypothetical protein